MINIMHTHIHSMNCLYELFFKREKIMVMRCCRGINLLCELILRELIH